MCGIVGIAGNLFFKEEKTMQSLLLLDYFRGTDSTGLASVTNGGTVKIAKLATDPITLFQFPKFKDALNGNASKLFLGHNRATTSGGTDNYNAHPFQHGHITGVQNGTLEYKDKTALEEKLGEKFNVDTQALFASIAAFGVKETIEMLHEGSDSQRGAWSLVWYDAKEDTINFLRNKWRPMWFCWQDDFKLLFFGSRYEMLRHAACMADTPYKLASYEFKDEKRKGETYTFFSLPENQHWKFKLEDIRKGSKERPKPTVKFIQGKEPKASGSYKQPVWDPFQTSGKFQQKAANSGGTTTTGSRIIGSTDRDGNGIFHLRPSCTAQPYTFVLPVSRFEELVRAVGQPHDTGGCSFCWKPINFGDPGIVVYDEQDTILCPSCSGHKGDENLPMAKIYVSPQAFVEFKKAA